jgi:hypothetical protein
MNEAIAIDDIEAATTFDAAHEALSRQGWAVLAPSLLEDGVRAVLGRFGAIVPQYNGEDTWEVTMKPGFERLPYSQSRNGIGPHTEVPVGNPPPHYLALHCHRQARCGQGHTRLADGMTFVRSLDAELQRYVHERPVQFAATLAPGTARRQTLTVPIIDASARGGRSVFRFSYNQFLYGDVNPSEAALSGVSSGASTGVSPRRGGDSRDPLVRLAMLAASYFESEAVPVLIPDGHLMIWDNHRLIHARSTYSDPARHLTRYWLQPQ